MRPKISKKFVALYALTFLVVLPLLCFNLKNSLYFLRRDEDGLRERLLKENSQRLDDAQRYFGMLERTKLNRVLQNGIQNSGGLSIVLTIITVSRNRHKVDSYEPKYMTQVAWKLLSLLHDVKVRGFPHQVSLEICNVDHDPATYEEALSISQFIPMFQRFNKTHFSMVHPLEKEKQDYIFCLNRSLESIPDYVFLVEDDALPTPDFFHVLDDVLKTHLSHRLVRGELLQQYEDIAYVKFYHPDWLLSFWSIENERIPELIALTVLIGTALTGFYMFSGGTNILNVALCLFLYSFLVVAAIGRPNFTKLRSVLSPHMYTFSSAPSCCTPAMLFPADGARAVVSYLDKVTCDNNFGKDSALDRLLLEKRMKAYLVQPSTFTHVGLYSALREKIVDPFIV